MSRFSRVLRLGAVTALALVGVTCRDGASTGPGIPARASVAVAPSIQMVPGGPHIRLVAARVTFLRVPRGDVALDTVATFPTSPGVRMEITLDVPLLKPSEELELSIRATDAAGDTVYRARRRVTLAQGTESPHSVAAELTYVGRDTVVHQIRVAPRDTTFRGGDAFAMRATATRVSGDTVPNVLVGWTSSAPTIARIDAATGAVTADLTAKGQAWIVGVTANGRRDSTLVNVVAPVAKVEIDAGAEVTIERGLTRRLSAATRDAAGNLLTGRAVAWRSTNAAGATVDAAGLVAALRADSVALVIATSEGKSDTVLVRVGRKPNARVKLSHTAETLVIGTVRTLTAASFDSAGAQNTDHPIVFASSDTSVAKVTPGTTPGVATVTAAKVGGPVVVTATAGNASATYTLTVTAVPVRAVSIAPRTPTHPAEDSLVLTATPKDSAGNVLAGRAVAFRSLDTAVATVRVLDETRAMVLTKVAGVVKVVAEREGAADTATVTVKPPRVASLTLTPTAAELNAGDSVQFVATARSARGTIVGGRGAAFRTLDAAVATANGNGWVLGRAAGSTKVVAELDGVADTSDVTVRQQMSGVAVVPGSVVLRVGGSRVLEATGLDAAGNPMPVNGTPVWSIDDERVATVDQSGTLRAVGSGTASVRVRVNGFLSEPAYVSVGDLAVLLPADTVRVGPGTVVSLPIRLSKAAVGLVVVDLGVLDVAGNVDPDSVLALGDAASGNFEEYERYFEPNDLVQHVRLTAVNPGVVKVVAFHYDGCDGPCSLGGRARMARASLGRSAETYAMDEEFIADTVVVKVEGAIAHLDRPVEVVPGDTAHARLELQAPAPAGGLRFVFDVTGEGRVRVLPDTVTVPAGQLAAPVRVVGVREGAALVTPRGVGHATAGAPSSAVVRARRLTIYIPDFGRRDTVIVGAGQIGTLASIVPSALDAPLRVALTSSNESVMRPADASLTVSPEARQPLVRVDGVAAGRAWLRATAPGWAADSVLVVVTTPHVELTSDYIYGYTHEEGGARTAGATVGLRARLGAVVRDSVAPWFSSEGEALALLPALRAPLAVTFSSSDTNVVAIDAAAWTLPAGAQDDTLYGPVARVKAVGTAWLHVRAPGHRADSVRVVVGDNGLTLYTGDYEGPDGGHDAHASKPRLLTAPGYQAQAAIIASDGPRRDQLAIGLKRATGAVSAPDSVFTPSTHSGYLDVTLRGARLGVDTLVASATGLAPDTLVVHVARPMLRLAVIVPDTLDRRLNVGVSYQLSVALADTLGRRRLAGVPFQQTWGGGTTVVQVESRDSSVVVPAQGVTLRDGARVFGVPLDVRAAGTTWLVHQTPGWKPDSIRVTVVPATISAFTHGVGYVGAGLKGSVGVASLSGAASLPARVLPVALDAAAANGDTLVYTSTSGRSFTVVGVTPGTARVELRDVTGRASGPAFGPDTVTVRVTRSFLGWETAANTSLLLGDTLVRRVAVRDSASHAPRGSASRLARRATLRVTSSDPSVLRVEGRADTLGGSPYVIPADSFYSPAFRLVAVGAGVATVTVEDTSAAGERFVAFRETFGVFGARAAAFHVDFDGGAKTMALGLRQRRDRPLQVCRAPGSGTDTLAVSLGSTDPLVASGVADGRAGAANFLLPPTGADWKFNGLSCASVQVHSGAREGTVGVIATARRGSAVVSTDTLRVAVAASRLVLRSDGWHGDGAELFTNDSTATFRVMLDAAGAEGTSRFVTLDSLAVRLVTSDASIAAPESTTVWIPAGGGASSPVRVLPTGAAGTVRLGAEFTPVNGVRYLRASSGDIVARVPALQIVHPSTDQGVVGLRTTLFAQSDNFVNELGPVTYTSLDPSVVEVVGTGVDEAPQDGAGVPLAYRAAGVGRVVARAPGHRPDTLVVRVAATGALEVAFVPTSTEPITGDSLATNGARRFRVQLADTTYDSRSDLTSDQDLVFDVEYDVAGVLEVRDVGGSTALTRIVVPAGQPVSGEYVIRGVAPGRARVVFRRAGFAPRATDRLRVYTPPS